MLQGEESAVTHIIRQFLRLEAAGGIILIAVAIVAMFMANTPLHTLYHVFLNVPISVGVLGHVIDKPLEWWINDALMALFFLTVGLEVKRELIQGSLAGYDKAVFPAIAACGGMLAPALIYLLFNGADAVARHGWAIPTATDIAFALGVMALLGKRVPLGLKVFLLALAIIDDLGAIVIIALFYTDALSVPALGAAATLVAVLALMNRSRVAKTSLYMIVGVGLWAAILASGIHATLAGVILGFMIPLKARQGDPLSERLEHGLHPWVAYFILPLFAFANAGVSLQGVSLGGLTSMLPLGIATGLLIGKPLGIFTFSFLAVKLGIARLPEGVGFRQIFAVSVLCGIGFTMSMFIATLAFGSTDAAFGVYSRLGILLGSTLAALLGYSLLRLYLPKRA